MVANAAVVGLTNATTAITRPQAYLDYAALTPVAVYRNFIIGWFSEHARWLVLTIAVGQLAIGVLLIRPRPWRVLGVLGAVVCLLAIAPLGVGSAFPFSLTFSAAIIVMDRGLCGHDAANLLSSPALDHR